MKVGDLVIDVEAKNIFGIVVKIDEPEGMYKIQWPRGSEWLTEMYLEVISESR